MTVQAERLNFLRFISHFRAVHRGASFAGLRTTSVRKLLPEYVFVCLFFRFYSSTFIVANVLCALSLSLSPANHCADLGVLYALFTHLTGSHVDCLIT